LSNFRSPEATVLLVEDEPGYVDLLSISLEARGYAVLVARDGAAALVAADRGSPDVTILDLGLPDVDGIEVCRHLRRSSHTPIVVVTADGAEARKVQALTEGADDYITKPFSMPELMARVRVALRHRRLLARLVDGGLLRLGDLTMDTDAHTAAVGVSPIGLAAKEFALLEFLLRNAGSVMTHQQLFDRVWGGESSLVTLRSHVAQLRRKIGEGPGRPRIEGHPRIGYRLHLPG
jgi:two-component system KDP operon response regulator KdpE